MEAMTIFVGMQKLTLEQTNLRKWLEQCQKVTQCHEENAETNQSWWDRDNQMSDADRRKLETQVLIEEMVVLNGVVASQLANGHISNGQDYQYEKVVNGDNTGIQLEEIDKLDDL